MQRLKWTDFRDRHDIDDAQFEAARQAIGPTPRGPWIVGGAVRRLISQAPQDSDFDVAFASADQLEKTFQAMTAAGFKKGRVTNSYVEMIGQLGKRSQQKVQLLKMTYAETPEAHIDSFDFTICQCAFDGTDLILGDYALWDIARKRLALHKVSFGASSVRRMTKYAKQGYTFCQGTIVSILEAVAKDPGVIRAEIDYVD